MIEGDIKKIFVVGAGVMGHGLAQSFAEGGYQVSLFSRTQKTLDRARGLIESSLNTKAKEGLSDGSQIPGILERITTTTSLEEGAHDADIALETVVENVQAKKDIFAQMDAHCPPKTILASNTSFLNIFDFVETSRPDKVLIAHWYAPPQLIPLVEVVKGPKTDGANVELMAQILRKMGKKPAVMQKFIPGFIINRLQITFYRECHFLVDNDYITPQELDEAAKYGLALRMMVLGVMQRIDFGGLDTSAKIQDNLNIQPVPLDYRPKKLFELVEQGHFGVKTGKGYYDYTGRTEAECYQERDLGLIRLLKMLQS
jgi:3-hydroxyacyl-CoA dehydrogenase